MLQLSDNKQRIPTQGSWQVSQNYAAALSHALFLLSHSVTLCTTLRYVLQRFIMFCPRCIYIAKHNMGYLQIWLLLLLLLLSVNQQTPMWAFQSARLVDSHVGYPVDMTSHPCLRLGSSIQYCRLSMSTLSYLRLSTLPQSDQLVIPDEKSLRNRSQ